MKKLAFIAAVLARAAHAAAPTPEYYGTLEPFASQAVYFVLTDRFVNGDPDNDQRQQGGARRTFDIAIQGPGDDTDNVGYLGGDFRGLLDNAAYIREMGFSAVWITPIVDNPDEAFSGGDPVRWGGMFTDGGKTGYHGYWGVNFYQLDEHLPSPGLDFAAFTRALKAQGLDTVLDIVANHGSPSYTMVEDQPKFGEIYDASGKLVADHQNLPPGQLKPQDNPLHAFFRAEPELAQLSNLDHDNPAVQDYVINAVLEWVGQGAAALRIDTIRWMPHAFWKKFSERVRAAHPGLFMFGEAFDYDAAKIAEHTWPQNGGYSVLDFPLQAQLVQVFAKAGDFSQLESPLMLEDGPYTNPYELTTFYDNHDMARMDATDAGFIDAHNWLFTARGIPVIYYGSEIGFERGRGEHAGNRNYFGPERIAVARSHPIRERLQRIARVRQASPALQRGLQLNVKLQGDEAVFYRIYQHEGVAQTALVLLNKGDVRRTMVVREFLEPGRWQDALSGEVLSLSGALAADVPPHDVRVFLSSSPVTRKDTRAKLDRLMRHKSARPVLSNAPAVARP
jgi:glycosidase